MFSRLLTFPYFFNFFFASFPSHSPLISPSHPFHCFFLFFFPSPIVALFILSTIFLPLPSSPFLLSSAPLPSRFFFIIILSSSPHWTHSYLIWPFWTYLTSIYPLVMTFFGYFFSSLSSFVSFPRTTSLSTLKLPEAQSRFHFFLLSGLFFLAFICRSLLLTTSPPLPHLTYPGLVFPILPSLCFLLYVVLLLFPPNWNQPQIIFKFYLWIICFFLFVFCSLLTPTCFPPLLAQFIPIPSFHISCPYCFYLFLLHDLSSPRSSCCIPPHLSPHLPFFQP